MPLGDEKHKQIYDELVNILGAEYVSDERVVAEAYSREAQTPSFATKKRRAEFIVLNERVFFRCLLNQRNHVKRISHFPVEFDGSILGNPESICARSSAHC